MSKNALLDQPQLFETPTEAHTLATYRDFIHKELTEELPLVGVQIPVEGPFIFEADDDTHVMVTLDVLAIAASGITEEMAAIDTVVSITTDDERVCSEAIADKINPKGDSDLGNPFDFDVDRDSEFARLDLTFDGFVDALTDRAYQMAGAMLTELRTETLRI